MSPRIQPLAPSPRPGPAIWRRCLPPARLAVAVVCVALAAGACGKKGPPLPPLLRIPAKVAALATHRAGDAVFVTLTVPAANIGGDSPADVALVEVYAVTAARPPELENGRVPATLTRVSSAPVRRPVPPPPPAANEAPPVPPLPVEPGVDQGTAVTFREVLTPALLRETELEETADADAPVAPAIDLDPAVMLSLPLVFTPETMTVRRHYVAVAVSRQGRRGPWSDWQSVPVSATSGAPGAPTATYDDTALAVSWTPAPDARLAPAPPAEGALESRPFGPVRAATRYNLYPAPTPGADGADPVTPPVPLNDAPLALPPLSLPDVAFGSERCFVVRGVDTIDGVDVEGPASPAGCVTPRDTFPPAAPAALEAVAGAGVISLIWEAVDAADLAGYLVFRGTAPGEPTTPLTPEPIGATSFEDRTVTAGVRYVYVVVAVDSATLANRSAPSNRAEETARQ